MLGLKLNPVIKGGSSYFWVAAQVEIRQMLGLLINVPRIFLYGPIMSTDALNFVD